MTERSEDSAERFDMNSFKEDLIAIQKLFEVVAPHLKIVEGSDFYLKDGATLKIKLKEPAQLDLKGPDGEDLGEESVSEVYATYFNVFWPDGNPGILNTIDVQFCLDNPDGTWQQAFVRPGLIEGIELIGLGVEAQPQTRDILPGILDSYALLKNLLEASAEYDGSDFTLTEGNRIEAIFKDPVNVYEFNDSLDLVNPQLVKGFVFNVISMGTDLEDGEISLYNYLGPGAGLVMENVPLSDFESLVLVVGTEEAGDHQ